jgi:hypothetical protein
VRELEIAKEIVELWGDVPATLNNLERFKADLASRYPGFKIDFDPWNQILEIEANQERGQIHDWVGYDS